MALEPELFDQLAVIVRAACGGALGRDQAALIESRLTPLVRRLELDGVSALVRRLGAGEDRALLHAVVDAVTVHETSFFRDGAPFEHLRREVLPALAAARPGETIRIWSVGCATGQEVWSLAMLADAARAELGGARVEILGSDISERCLEKAQTGLYTQFEVQRGLPIRQLLDAFEKVDETWRPSPRLHQLVRWRRFNLMTEPATLGRFDVILCRNVLSWFDAPTRAGVLERLEGVLADDGRLVLGLGETAHGLSDAFRPVAGRRGVYQKASAAARRVA